VFAEWKTPIGYSNNPSGSDMFFFPMGNLNHYYDKLFQILRFLIILNKEIVNNKHVLSNLQNDNKTLI